MRRNYIQQLVLFFACLIISVSCNREENACRLKEMEHLISENPQMALDSLNKLRNTATLAGHATYNHYLFCLADAQNKAADVMKTAAEKAEQLRAQVQKEAEAEIAKTAILAAEKILSSKAA